MSDFKVTTPVVLIIFNRPEKTRKVLRAIADARPSQLFVIGDGPRESKEGEAERVAECRSIIEHIDWDCQVFTRYSDVNLGCRLGISSGLSWVFQLVPEAIILEDDCLPHPTFFRFCQELLDYYRHDNRVGMISGNNFHPASRINGESYYFSNNSHIWGWATWADRWLADYDVDMKAWEDFKVDCDLSQFWDDPQQQNHYFTMFDALSKGTTQIDAWDYQWLFANQFNGRVSIAPSVNLISNIGFDMQATHTKFDHYLSNFPAKDMIFPLRHPKDVVVNRALDRREFRLIHGRSLFDRIRRRFFRLWQQR